MVQGNVRLQSELFSSGKKRTVLLCLLLLLATLAVYNPIVHNEFTNFDDNTLISENSSIQSGLTWTSVKWAFTTLYIANWQPLTWLSHIIDWQMFGKNPAGHHYENALLHAVNAILLFLLLQSATGFTWRSLAVAVIFALHPVNVESVAWASERKNVLSMAFFLTAMLAYGRYARQPSVRRYAVVFLLFGLGLMTKPQIITLPCVLLLWDFWPLQRVLGFRDADLTHSIPQFSVGRIAGEKVPLLLLSAASAMVTMYAQREGSAVRSLADYSLHARISNAFVSYVRYVAHAFLPLHLSPTYCHPAEGIPLWEVVCCSALLAIVSGLLIASPKRYLLVGWLWFLGTLVPMIGLVQVGDQAMADRYAYIPYIGLFWMVVWAISDALPKWRIAPMWAIVPLVLAVGVSGFLARRQLARWHDSETLWRYAISVDSRDWIAHANLGRAMISKNRPEEAIQEFTIAESLHKYATSEVLRLADYKLRYEHTDDAVVLCQNVLAETQDPHYRAVAYANLGVAALRHGELTNAKHRFIDSLRSESENSAALLGLGIVAERSRDYDQAAQYYSQSLKIRPDALGYFLLSTALEKSGKRQEAIAAFRQAQAETTELQNVLRWAHLLLPE